MSSDFDKDPLFAYTKKLGKDLMKEFNHKNENGILVHFSSLARNDNSELQIEVGLTRDFTLEEKRKFDDMCKEAPLPVKIRVEPIARRI